MPGTVSFHLLNNAFGTILFTARFYSQVNARQVLSRGNKQVKEITINRGYVETFTFEEELIA